MHTPYYGYSLLLHTTPYMLPLDQFTICRYALPVHYLLFEFVKSQ